LSLALAAAAALAWLVLIAARGGFWLCRERDEGPLPDPAHWPEVVAVVPARNEADVIESSIGSLLRQDYPGPFRVILVDDHSEDGTGDAARSAFPVDRLAVLSAPPLAEGWTGKLAAQNFGVSQAGAPEWLWLTDADIAHAPDTLRRLVARGEAHRLALVSRMAQLKTDHLAERAMIPAFVFFFAMLFPFARVNQTTNPVAAAAGGCMLVRRQALEAAGGLAMIRREIIDDCALARLLKPQGGLWLGLSHDSASLRPYGGLGEIGAMISRSAFAQLRFSPWLLVGTVLGMGLVFLAGPVLAVASGGPARWIGASVWLAMALAYQPVLRFYRLSPFWGATLPAIGVLYTAFTVQSALEFWAGRGGRWKGRAQAMAA
jgi:hopene-associated glycosyltransferase HpnB